MDKIALKKQRTASPKKKLTSEVLIQVDGQIMDEYGGDFSLKESKRRGALVVNKYEARGGSSHKADAMEVTYEDGDNWVYIVYLKNGKQVLQSEMKVTPQLYYRLPIID